MHKTLLFISYSPNLAAQKTGARMKSNVEKISGLERKLSIVVPPETVNSMFEKAYKGIQSRVNIPGFRKGKAPMPVIKQKYKGHVISDVVNDLVKDAYVKALVEHSIDPVSYPQISFDNVEENQAFQFSATVEIRPKVELKKTSGLKVQKEKLEVGDKQVDEILKNLQDSKTQHVDSTKAALAQGDVAMIDFEGFIAGEPLAGGKGENYPLEIGSNQFIPGFEEKLIGMALGEERKIAVKFPDDYHAADIAGKPVEFNVKLNKIQEKKTPELNDEFAKTVGTYETLAALKANIRETIEKREATRISEDFRKRLLKVLVNENEFDVPKTQVSEQREVLLKDMQSRMQNQGLPEAELKTYEEKWAAELDDAAKFMIQSGYLVNELAKTKEVKITDEDRSAKLRAYAEESGISFEQLSQFYKKDESQSRLDYQIIEEKVLDLVAKDCKIEEVEKSKIKEL
jgi:trigger factor